MDFKELKTKTEAELQKTLAESRDKLRELRFKDANKQLKDIRQIRKVRETISQVMTVLNILKKKPTVAAEAVKEETVDKKKTWEIRN